MNVRTIIEGEEVRVQAEDDAGFVFSDVRVNFDRDATTIDVEKVRVVVSRHLCALHVNGKRVASESIK